MRLAPLLLILTLAPLSAAAQTLYVKQSDEGYLNLRDGPGTRHDVMRRLAPGDRVDIEETVGRWARVRLPSGERGWVSSTYLERAPERTAPILFVNRTVTGYLNMRGGPGTDRPILRRLYPGDRLQPIGTEGEWLRVRHATGAIGWVHRDYVSS